MQIIVVTLSNKQSLFLKVSAIARFAQSVCQFVWRDDISEFHTSGDLLRACDFECLTSINGLDELRSLKQRCMVAGVEPRSTITHHDHIHVCIAEIRPVDIGILRFATCRGLERCSNVRNRVVLEI